MTARYSAAKEKLRAMIAEVRGGRLWQVVPTLEDAHLWRARRLWPVTARVHRANPGLAGIRVGATTFLWTTENQRRVLEPVAAGLASNRGVTSDGFGWRHDRAVPARLDSRISASDRAVARTLAAALPSHTGASEKWWIARAISLARIVENEWHPRVGELETLIVASQHDPALRAAIDVTRSAGRRVGFFSHAPITRLPQHLDFPFDFVGLRGPAEVEFVRSQLAVDGAVIVAVGDAGIVSRMVDSSPQRKGPTPIVLALSPDPSPVVSCLIALVARATEEPVVVAPHPRSNRREIARIIPRNWILHEGERTSTLLARGARVLLQQSSGVALEGMELGIPTIDIAPDGATSPYPFFDSSVIPKVATAEQLSEQLAAIDAGEGVSTEALCTYARRWRSAVGSEAIEQSVSLINRMQHASRGLVYDRWFGSTGPGSST